MKYIGLTRPSYPLGATKESHYFGHYNFETKIGTWGFSRTTDIVNIQIRQISDS